MGLYSYVKIYEQYQDKTLKINICISENKEI